MDDQQSQSTAVDLGMDEAFEVVTEAARRTAPGLVETLVAGHYARSARLLRVSTVFWPALDGLEELYQALNASRGALAVSAMPQTADLVSRSLGDFETAFDCLLSGRYHIVSDAMRDTMEIELLLLSFASDQESYDDWACADREVLVSRFGPDRLRKRLADALFEVPMDLPDKFEYQMHSGIAHPTNSRTVATAFQQQATDDDLAVYLFEMLEHGRRVLAACALLLGEGALNLLDASPELPRLERLRAGSEYLQAGFQPQVDGAVSAGLLPPRRAYHRGAWKGFGTPPPRRSGQAEGS